MDYNVLKDAIKAYVKDRTGLDTIDGDGLQETLLAIVNSIGVGYVFMGVADLTTNPGTPDQRVWYFAATAGIYANFNNIVLNQYEIAVLKWDTEWHKEVIPDIPSKSQIDERLDEQDGRLDGQDARLDDQDEEIADFEEAVQNQVDNYPMITINGNVTNAPDEEDITSDANDLLKFKNRSAVDGMGYAILRKGGSNTFENQVTAANTIYEIRYDFDLGGASVTIPAGCVLNFVGGKLSNGSIDLNGCVVSAPEICVFDGVTISGVNDGDFDLSWLTNGDDLTGIINGLPATITRIKFHSDKTFYLSDTATFNGIKFLDWKANVYYSGTGTDRSVLRLVGCNSARICIDGKLSGENSDAIDQLADNTNIVGVEVVNCQDCSIYINGIAYFNENLRVSGIGAGCSNNAFYIGRFYCANRHIRLYQEDADENVGWANENYFYNGHLFNFNDWKSAGNKSTAVHIQGGSTDAFNQCDGLTFLNMNLEGYGGMNGYTIYAKNIHNCSFLRIRNEGGDDLIKMVGDCGQVDIDVSYGKRSIEATDLTIANPLAPKSAIPIYNVGVKDILKHYWPVVLGQRWMSDVLTDIAGGHKYLYNTGSGVVGMRIKYASVAGGVLYMSQRSNVNSFYMRFLDSNGAAVTPIAARQPFSTISNSTYMTYTNVPTASIYIPEGLENVDSIVIGFVFNPTTGVSSFLEIASDKKLIFDILDIPKRGTFVNRPVVANDNYIGQEYFCTDRGYKIWWNGTTWVDATGTPVS